MGLVPVEKSSAMGPVGCRRQQSFRLVWLSGVVAHETGTGGKNIKCWNMKVSSENNLFGHLIAIRAVLDIQAAGADACESDA